MMFWKRKKPFEKENVDPRLLSANHIWEVGREQFRTALDNIRVGRGWITPCLLLIQLHFGGIDPEKIRAQIMDFDDGQIGQALNALIERGMK